MLLLINKAMYGEMTEAVVLRSLGPRPSRPVALDEASLLIWEITCSTVI